MSSDSDSDSDLSRKFGNDSSGDEKEVKKEDKKDTTPQVQNSMLQQSAHIENPPNNIPQISMIETTESKVPEQSNQTSSLMKNDISNIKPKEEDDNGNADNSNYDTKYVAIAPQLGISLVSQYRNNEVDLEKMSSDNYASISPSVLILPRIIYLTQDAEGKLPDYYNVINLNGANETKTPSRVACNPSLPTTAALYDGENLLSEGVYTCTYTSNDGAEIPFYVVVSSVGTSIPKVHFESAFAELTSDVSAKINLVVPASTQAQEINVNVLAPTMPAGWNYVANSTYLKWVSGNLYTATVTPSALNDVTAELFTVSVEPGTTEGTATFQLMTPCNGCVITSPDVETAYISGVATVIRSGLEEYCSNHEENCPANSEYDRVKSRPNCDALVNSSDVWVKASGMNCRTTAVNHQWVCGLSNAISLKSASGYPGAKPLCRYRN